MIPIIADDILVDPKFGTGCVKVTPAHDPNDYAVWQRHRGLADEIDIINLLNPEGTLNENAGAYSGMRRDQARKKVVEDLTQQGLLVKEEPYETQVGHSDRSKTAIEPYLSDQWFVHMAPLAEPALEVVREGLIKFHPERHAHQYLAWLGEKRDWPISRQLWWGHRIPVWTVVFEGEPIRPDEQFDQYAQRQRKYVSEVKQLLSHYLASCGVDTAADVFFVGSDQSLDYEIRFSLRTKLASDAIDAFSKMSDSYEMKPVIPGVRNEPALGKVPGFEQATKAYFDLSEKVLDIVQDPDVLDTWFSSALWPHSTLGWPEKTPDLAKWNPTSVLITARDIITLWVARMVMFNLYNMGENQWTSESEGEAKSKIKNQKSKIAQHIPFTHVVINPTILDGKGERMSKSKGNGVDPVDIIETHGADALRFTMTQMATETQDVRLPVKKLPNGKNSSEKFDFGRNFCNKLWNASRFALANLETVPPIENRKSKIENLSLADKWILSRLARTIAEANEALANFRFDVYARVCYDFFWRDFCDWYVEIVKPTFKDPAKAQTTAAVLAAALDQSLRLMHPVIPFITETIWWKLNEVCPDRSIAGLVEAPASDLLIRAAWPTVGAALVDEKVEQEFTLLQEIIVAIRNVRNEHKVDVKRVVDVSIGAATEEAVSVLRQAQGMVEMLATCKIVTIAGAVAAPADAVRAAVAGCEIFVEGLIDADTEKLRIAKRKEDLVKQVAALSGRLGNAGYIERAPARLVEETQKQLADAEAELAKL